MIVAATGMGREARILGRYGVTSVVRGSDARAFRAKLERAIAQGARGIISIGIAGALNPILRTGDILIGGAVATPGGFFDTDTAWQERLRARFPIAKTAIIAGAERIALRREAKAALFEATKADAVDLESGIAAELARAHAVPFAILRVVSDEAATALPAAAEVALDSEGRVKFAALCGSILARPAQLPQLMRAAGDSRAALKALLRCLDFVGRGLAGPDLG